MRDQILKRKVNMNIETENNDYWRWLGFLLAVFGAYVLGNAEVNSQWLGWSICTVSCLIWIFMGIKDRDIPRTLMEIMYFIIGLRAIVNWLNFS